MNLPGRLLNRLLTHSPSPSCAAIHTTCSARQVVIHKSGSVGSYHRLARSYTSQLARSYTASHLLANNNVQLRPTLTNKLTSIDVNCSTNKRTINTSSRANCDGPTNGSSTGDLSDVDINAIIDSSFDDFDELVDTDEQQPLGTTGEGGASHMTHFGYQQVREEDKSDKVHGVFKNVAESYDLMNDAMSAGVHRLWKHEFVSRLNVRPGMTILDVAGGTGDISFKMLDSLVGKTGGHNSEALNATHMTVFDINQPMLDVGMERARKLGIEDRFDWVQGNAESLPFEDNSVDIYTIAFGIRNCTHIEKVLDEAWRVLKSGGRFSCLEFSTVDNAILRQLYDQYSFSVIPAMGHVLAGDWNSYQYLVESIRQFPSQREFGDMLYDAGFCNVTYNNLTLGVAAIHNGFKI